MVSSGEAKIGLNSGRELKIQNHVNLPFDPLQLKSMAEYNFALLVTRNWFEYDEGRKPLPGIIDSWSFQADKGSYTFHISKEAKWSDGTAITSSDLKFNLDRATRLKTSYGQSISSLVDLSSYKEISSSEFQLTTRDKKPSTSLFERMGSVFLAIVSSSDVDSTTFKVKSNNKSAGPFVVKGNEGGNLVLVPNPFFPQNKNAAEKIILGSDPKSFDLDRFLEGKSWENLAQFTSFVPTSWEQKILKNKLPYWTRGHDRVSLLRPGFGPRAKRGRQIIKAINSSFCDYKEKEKLPFNVTRSYSLQPESYPLHHEKIACSRSKISEGKISILATDSPVVKFHMEILNDFFKSQGVEVTWDLLPFGKYIEGIGSSENHDIIFLNFGVADPEPATWMSLIRDAGFISFDADDLKQFDSIFKIENKVESVSKYKVLLKDVLNKGGYAPLYYGSTLALGHKGLSFKQMRELDETVNLSKVIFE
jgi:MarR-like DNA-binding transcriptional regulator SgrR of sgrS sRNA